MNEPKLKFRPARQIKSWSLCKPDRGKGSAQKPDIWIGKFKAENQTEIKIRPLNSDSYLVLRTAKIRKNKQKAFSS